MGNEIQSKDSKIRGSGVRRFDVLTLDGMPVGRACCLNEGDGFVNICGLQYQLEEVKCAKEAVREEKP